MNTTRLLVADAHAVVRAGLKALVGAEPGIEVVAEAADGPAAVALAATVDPDVVVVGVPLPGLSGPEFTARLRQQNPVRKVLLMAARDDARCLRPLLEAGASGYVFRCATAGELVEAVRAVAGGGTYSGALAPAVAEAEGTDLSAREADVVRFIALGYSNKEIALRLELSVKTVETYKARSMEKLAARSRVDLVRYAARRGWLDGE